MTTAFSSCLSDADQDFLTLNLAVSDASTGFPLVEVPAATRIPGATAGYQVWADVDGRLPTSDNDVQIFALIDSDDMIDERNESNNLVCINCVPSPSHSPGVIVRLPLGTEIDDLFPPAYRSAARKLRAGFPRYYYYRDQYIRDLGDPVIPISALP